jgi:tRNA modification GTPase
MIDLSDTICALSSGRGRSGIAVIRLSGTRCFDIVDRIFHSAYPNTACENRRAVLGRIVDPRSGELIDQAVVTRFNEPHSYTGENVAEISVHGSPIIVATVMEILCGLGARTAEPGEFTMRAVLMGRMDLAQAEAVRDVIEANTRFQLQIAARQLGGSLSKGLEEIKGRMRDLIVEMETAVEFPDVEIEEERKQWNGRLKGLESEIGKWAGTFGSGRIVHDGFQIAIIGRPNAGKSSLFNALLKEERSIVTEEPGTTRDSIAELIEVEGIPVRLIDTAGMRSGGDRIEALGVERSRRALVDADAVILVADTSVNPDYEHEEMMNEVRGRECLVVFSKADLPCAWSEEKKETYLELGPVVEVSAKTGRGIEELRQAIHRRLCGGNGDRDGILVTNLRHYQCLSRAKIFMEKAVESLEAGISEEFVLSDLYLATDRLGEITGPIEGEEILAEIFGRFCVGK